MASKEVILKGHTGEISSISFDKKGRKLASYS